MTPGGQENPTEKTVKYVLTQRDSDLDSIKEKMMKSLPVGCCWDLNHIFETKDYTNQQTRTIDVHQPSAVQ